MFSLITTIIAIALAVGVTGATMYYLSGTDESASTIAAAELLTQSEQIAAAIDMRAFQEKGELSDLNALVTSKYLMQVPLPPEYAFVSGESSVSDWQVPQANPRPVVLVSNKIKASVCAAFNNKMLSDASIPAKANPALRIQCFGAEEPYSVVINPSMNPDQLVAVLPSDTNTTTPEPDAQLPVPQTVALSSANLCFKQGVAGSFDFKTVFSASQEATPSMSDVVWAASGTLPAGMSFDSDTGVLSGTPTAQGQGEYTVTATYKGAEGQQVYKLLVPGSELEAVTLASGYYHTCAVTATGDVRCWGDNDYGQLGNNSTLTTAVPEYVVNLPNKAVSISTGQYHSCALLVDNQIYCWGKSDRGQLGDALAAKSTVPVKVSGMPPEIVAITSGFDYNCVLTRVGSVWCWGYNGYGQLGLGHTTSTTIPQQVIGLSSGVTSVSASMGGHTCAIQGLDTFCWGFGFYGQLGLGNKWFSPTVPTRVPGLSAPLRTISTGWLHTCGVTVAGGVLCWGNNDYELMGPDVADRISEIPVAHPALATDVKSVMAYSRETCVQLTTGVFKCFGYNHSGHLGLSHNSNVTTPTEISALGATSAQLTMGQSHSCAVTRTGRVMCWGSNAASQLGVPNGYGSYTPIPTVDPLKTQTCTDITLTPSTDGSKNPTVSGVISLTPATLPEFKVGQPATYNFAALYKDSLNPTPNMADVTWSGVGTLPAGLTLDSATGVLSGTPTEKGVVSYTVKATYKGSNSGQQTYQVVVQEGSNKFKQIDSSNSYGMACGVKTNGSVHCWHVSDTYMTRAAVPAPETSTAVSGLTSGVAAVTVGADYICALMDSGGVKCLGANDSGQLGNGNNIAQQSPVDVVGLSSGVKSISAGHRQTCAVLTSGSVKCWGSDEYGAAGLGVDALGHAIGSNIPVTVAGLETGVKALDASYTRTCALMTSGGVKCWGNGWRGGPDANGYSTLAWTTTPQDIVGISNAVEITTTDFYTGCALTATGGVKCWGLRGYTGTSEILGFSSSEADESPRDVIGLTSGVKSISRSCALLNTGGVKCWGDGGNKLFPGWNLPKDMSGATEGVNSLGGSCVVTTLGVAKCWGVIMNTPGPLSN